MGRSRAPQAARSTNTKTQSRAVGAASPGGYREELYEWIVRQTSQKQRRDVWVDYVSNKPKTEKRCMDGLCVQQTKNREEMYGWIMRPTGRTIHSYKTMIRAAGAASHGNRR